MLDGLNMKIQTEIIYNHLGLPKRADTASTTGTGAIAKSLKKTKDKAVDFFEAPFKTQVVIIETAEDHLE